MKTWEEAVKAGEQASLYFVCPRCGQKVIATSLDKAVIHPAYTGHICRTCAETLAMADEDWEVE